MYSMNFRVVPKAGIDTGIESVREILKSCVFDEEKCAVGISHLEGYRKEWDDSAAAGKTNPFTTSHRTAPTASLCRGEEQPQAGRHSILLRSIASERTR